VLQNNTATDFGGGGAFVQRPGVTFTLKSSTVSNNKVTTTTPSSLHACSECLQRIWLAMMAQDLANSCATLQTGQCGWGTARR
jgi:hypothetical protein